MARSRTSSCAGSGISSVSSSSSKVRLAEASAACRELGVDHVGCLGQRLRRLVDVLEEGLNDADGHGAV